VAVAVTAKVPFDCRTCGACCAYDAAWPQFIGNRDGAAIPEAHVSDDRRGMRCVGDRCTALAGEIGRTVECTVYAGRPLVCRELQPGDDDCLTARRAHGLPVGGP